MSSVPSMSAVGQKGKARLPDNDCTLLHFDESELPPPRSPPEFHLDLIWPPGIARRSLGAEAVDENENTVASSSKVQLGPQHHQDFLGFIDLTEVDDEPLQNLGFIDLTEVDDKPLQDLETAGLGDFDSQDFQTCRHPKRTHQVAFGDSVIDLTD